MLEKQVDLFSDYVMTRARVICIPTNLDVKKNGEAVMGAGVALEAAKRWLDLPGLLGSSIRTDNTRGIYLLKNIDGVLLCAYTTKFGWRDSSPLWLVVESAIELIKRYERWDFGQESVFLPRVGCGLGGLSWENDVKPILSRLFDDRFCVVYK